jgi:hypothetical protein
MINPGRLVVKTIDTKDLRLEENAGMAYPQVYENYLDVPLTAGEVKVMGLNSSYSASLIVAVDIDGELAWKAAIMADSGVVPPDGLPFYA